MIHFTKITYDQISNILSIACPTWDGSDNVYIDETKITAAEFALLKRYLEQENYKAIN